MRKSGILMHISSLPGPYGIGTMGESAYTFVDFLEKAGQSYWQILPLCPTGYGDSPYQSFSTFAGNPYLIDPDILVQEGLLTQQEVAQHRTACDRVDYGWLYQNRMKLLRKAYTRFKPDSAYTCFENKNSWWLDDFTLFMALKDHFRGKPWQEWSLSVVMRLPAMLESFRSLLAENIQFYSFLQYQFRIQWDRLHSYARKKGICIIGDVPIYVPLDSADVWANPGLFQLDAACRPKLVAGCPPDSFSAEGQLWGNPLYNWDRMREDGYRWWVSRLRAAGSLYDVIRFDHFRGLESYWAVPADERNAVRGSWHPGPGEDFIKAVHQALPELSFIAEDLGFVTPEVRDLLAFSGYPGMKVLQFAFDSREAGDYLPTNYPENSVCYSGTHDNTTLAGWLTDARCDDVAKAKAYLKIDSNQAFAPAMIRTAMESVSRLCIIQMQDWLGLGSAARMNTPGTLSDKNWSWRVDAQALSDALANQIRCVTEETNRI